MRLARALAVLAGAAGAWAVVGCGGSRAPAPDPAPQNVVQPPARSTPAPAIAWQDEHLVTTGLPAVARAGELAVIDMRDNDSGRGNANLRIEVRDRTDRLVQTIPVMTADEAEALAPGGHASPTLARRIADANRALASLHQLHDLVAMQPLEVQKPSGSLAHLAIGHDIDVDFSDAHLDVLVHDGERVLAHRATGGWEAAPEKSCAQCPVCDHPAFLGAAYHVTGIDLVVVDIAYMGTDTCWESSDQRHVVSW